MGRGSIVFCIFLAVLADSSAARCDSLRVEDVAKMRRGEATVNFASGSPEWRYLAVIDALSANGYSIESTTTTFLNRIKIRAKNVVHLREIVISRASGQILRDAVIEVYGTIALSLDERMQPVIPEILIENSPDGIMIISQ